MCHICHRKFDAVPFPNTTTKNIMYDVFLTAFTRAIMMEYFDIFADTLKYF